MEDFLRSFFLPCTLSPKSSMSSSESEVKKKTFLYLQHSPTQRIMVTGCWQALLLLTMPPAPIMYLFFFTLYPQRNLARNEPLSCICFFALLYSQQILQRIHPWPLLTFVACLCQSWIANQLDWGNRKWLFVSQSSADQDYQSEASSNIVRHILQYRERHP